jgi:hypothetical protein
LCLDLIAVKRIYGVHLFAAANCFVAWKRLRTRHVSPSKMPSQVRPAVWQAVQIFCRVVVSAALIAVLTFAEVYGPGAADPPNTAAAEDPGVEVVNPPLLDTPNKSIQPVPLYVR